MAGHDKEEKDTEAFNEERYRNLALTDLILYAVFSLQKKGIETTFENLVAESYTLFPASFSLPGYPQWPDARRVAREVQRLYGTFTEKNDESIPYLRGTIKSNFQFTNRGLEKLEEIQNKLKTDRKDRQAINKRKKDTRAKMEGVLYEVQKHELYKRYFQKGKDMDIPEHYLRDLLFATMETSNKELRKNIETLLSYCEAVGRDDIKEFLQFCKKKHKTIFTKSNG